MKLQRTPNTWSCGLMSLAMVLGKPYQELIDLIGHDGSEIIHPELKAPGCYKGFHIQELIDAALHLGYTATPIEVNPVQTPDGEHEHEIEFPKYKNLLGRFNHYLSIGDGLIEGQTNNKWWHTVAWDSTNHMICDPRGMIYPLDDLKINIMTFYLIKSF